MKLMCKLLSVLLLIVLLSGCGADSADASKPVASNALPSKHLTPGTLTPDTPTFDLPKSDVQAARETIASMLKLAEAGNWSNYVDQFYGESHKFRGPEDQAKLVQRFETKWGAKLLPVLQMINPLTPTIDEQGRAVFSQDGNLIFMLHKHEDGRWTFHL